VTERSPELILLAGASAVATAETAAPAELSRISRAGFPAGVVAAAAADDAEEADIKLAIHRRLSRRVRVRETPVQS
jgi:hypothetical protein